MNIGRNCGIFSFLFFVARAAVWRPGSEKIQNCKKKLEKPHTFFKFSMEFSIFEGHIDYRRLDVYTSVTCCTYIIGIAARYFRKIFCFWRKNWMRAEDRGAAGKSGVAGGMEKDSSFSR